MRALLKNQWMILLLLIAATSLVGCGGGGSHSPTPGNTTVTLESIAADDGLINSGSGGDFSFPETSIGEAGDNTDMYGVVSFDISSIPDDATIVSATLRIYQTSQTGNPYTKLGNVNVNHVQYSGIIDAILHINTLLALPSIGTLSTSFTANTYKELNVTASVQADIASPTLDRSKYLFYHTDIDGLNDGISDDDFWYMGENATNKPQLVIVYHQ